MIAVDTSVLLDVFTNDTRFAAASELLIGDALVAGDVVACEVVVAEMQLMLNTSRSVMDSLASLGIRFEALSQAAAVRAGQMNRRFRDRGGRRERAVADFLVGAHALLQCDALITRDAGFFRDYFKGLKVIAPKVD